MLDAGRGCKRGFFDFCFCMHRLYVSVSRVGLTLQRVPPGPTRNSILDCAIELSGRRSSILGLNSPLRSQKPLGKGGPPTFSSGFCGRRGRLDPKDRRFPALYLRRLCVFPCSPSFGGSRGRVRTVVFLQMPGCWAGFGGGRYKFYFYFDLKYTVGPHTYIQGSTNLGFLHVLCSTTEWGRYVKNKTKTTNLGKGHSGS
jgi:hypothetical protein